jgi:membrane fusion protein, multidrug efflux system
MQDLATPFALDRSNRRLAFACLLLALAGCQRELPPKVEPLRPVRSVVVAPQQLVTRLTLPAEIRPRVEARYGFRVGGKISQRLVSIGDRVTPGQVLARLDPQDAAPAVTSAQASLAAARTDAKIASLELRRNQELRERNYISQGSLDRQQATFDAATSRVDLAEAQLNQARNAVDFQTLKADVSGHVIAIEAEAGQVVASGQIVVKVAKDSEVEALVNVPEKDVAMARAAAQWQIVVPALAGRRLTGTLREFSPLSDSASRTYSMRLTMAGDLSGVEWGMTAVAQAAGSGVEGFVVPINSLYSKDGQSRLWLVDSSTQTVKSVVVKTDGLLDDAVRVVSGLAAGDRVVTAGANLLIEGQKVKLSDPVR